MRKLQIYLIKHFLAQSKCVPNCQNEGICESGICKCSQFFTGEQCTEIDDGKDKKKIKIFHILF